MRCAWSGSVEEMITRRALLTAGVVTGGAMLVGGFALVETDVLPGRIRLNELLGRNEPPPPVPSAEAGDVLSGTLSSRARGRDVGWTVAYPPGRGPGDPVPVCVALHGRFEDHDFPFATLHLDRFLASGVEQGVPEFAIASVDGGSATNWHPRASGDDPQAMLIDEFIPMLAEQGLQTSPVGIWGWSLGGYGALLLATELPPRLVGPVVATSPALWPTAAETAPDVFDDAEDYERNNVYERVDDLADVRLRIDIGDNDSFTSNVEGFIGMLAQEPSGGVTKGFHDAAYWMRAAPAEIAFIGRHLAASH
jgi:enterochelin esterase-like enzyme